MNKAVIAGVNVYQRPGCNLRGCINDVTNMRDILMRFYGFKAEDIRVVTDERATKANIMARLDWLVTGNKEGDRLLFHFSGHGSQVRDRDGDELSDRLDELICPTDMNFDGIYILDDDLRGVFSKLAPGVICDVILDSCHSGTGTREFVEEPCSGWKMEGAPDEYIKPRYMEPPIDFLSRYDVNDDLPVKKVLRAMENGMEAMNHCLFAGCRDNQTSADAYINNTYNGAMTYYLCKTIRNAGGKITRKELVRLTNASLLYNRYFQTPQLEGNINKLNLNFLS